MRKIEENYTLLVNNIKYKANNFGTELDSILDVIPYEVEIDFESRTVLNTYFKAETEAELKEFEGYFFSFVEMLNRSLIEEYSNVYSFIETSAKIIIDEMNKEQEYKRYKRDTRFVGKSELFKMIRFIDDNIFKFNTYDYITIDFIDDHIRKFRNNDQHNPYESLGNVITKAILKDNKNVDSKLRAVFSGYAENINSLYEVAENYKSILLKILSDKV
ncbi:hypothetical protein Q0V21_28780 [Paenibacillus sp. 11B]|uniref:hypothetical protein n=1 Tax=unclassified Paenibacillus TaxID=185978 RepID=UPI002655221F|nr:hypothetical protein [Paenibacillus sp. 11B]MDN8592720.1 hypothetical protein [Paenibacillus sp. 11B]